MKEPGEKITGYHWIMFLICFLATALAGTVSTLMSVYLPVAVKDVMGHQDPGQFNRISGYINSVFILGAAFGGLFAGWISDRWGRKTAVIFSIACYGTFTIVNGYMPHWWGIVACRFLSGVGMGAVLVTTTTLMMEEWPVRSRAIFMGILSISFPVGIFSAGVIDLFVSSWRQAFLVGIIPVIIAFLSIFLLRESVSWKLSRSVFTRKATGLMRPAKQIRLNLLKGSLIFGTMLIGLWAVFSWLPTWIQTLVKEGDGQNERGLSMMMLGMGGLVGGFISGWIINALGLRKSMLLCFGICALFSLLLFKTNNEIKPLVYAGILIIALAFGISQGVLSVYIPLLFPVAVRGRATGFCFNIGRFFTAAAVLFVGVLVSELGGYGSALFAFSFIFLAGFLVLLLTPDEPAVSEAEPTGQVAEQIILKNN
ncbi:MAG: MFS transporter [Chitinophagaceae bacterium]